MQNSPAQPGSKHSQVAVRELSRVFYEHNVVQSMERHCTQVQRTGRHITAKSGCRARVHVELPHISTRQRRIHRSVAIAHDGRCAAARRAV